MTPVFRETVLPWALGLLAAAAALSYLGGVLAPFALGTVVAYLLDPACRRLVRLGLPRGLASALLIVGVIAVVLGALLTVVPLLIEQVSEAGARLPGLIDALRRLLNDRLGTAGGEEMMQRLVDALRERASGMSGAALAQAWAGGKAVIGFASLMAVTPVVAFYLLYDWPRVLAAIDAMVPPRHAGTVRGVARDIDRVLSALLRGFGTVCLTLGAFYAVLLSLIGLDFGLLIGLFAGAISFIPFVGAALGGALSIGVAVAQFWSAPEWILAVAAVFAVGQAIEGNLLTPYFVGSAVQLHPLWLLFALAAFGALFGLVGLLVAVPAAAVAGVLVRRGVTRYKLSGLYSGAGRPEE